MSFLKKLFGGGDGGSGGGSGPVAEADHEGFHIVVTPQKDGGQYRLCGVISKEIGGETKEHTLIRADLFTGIDDCTEATIRKAKQVIDEQGDKLFSP